MSDSLEARLARIRELAKQGDHDAALRLSEQAASELPLEAEVWRMQGYVHARHGNHVDAVQALSRAIALQPNEPDYYFTRGRYYLAASDANRAIADFSKTIELCDLHRSDYYREIAHLMRAEALLRLGRHHEARADCSHVADDAAVWVDASVSKKAILESCDKFGS
jgi:tetratricopeptide (TPR) repeat protein